MATPILGGWYSLVGKKKETSYRLRWEINLMQTQELNKKKSTSTLITLTVALGMFPVVLDSTIVNVALIPISKALHTDLNTIQWISVGYLLANAAVVSLSGYLANRYGAKRLFLTGITLFGIFSLLCGLAPSEGWLI